MTLEMKIENEFGRMMMEIMKLQTAVEQQNVSITDMNQAHEKEVLAFQDEIRELKGEKDELGK
jgi:hypothetical protein